MENDEQQAFEDDAFSSGRKLRHTADVIQKRFRCNIDELAVWRNILLYRYSSISHSALNLEVTDFGHNDDILSGPALQWISRIPKELSKTTIRLFWGSTKRITVTLYFKAICDAGTLLCQGQDCYFWDIEECEKIKGSVAGYIQTKDLASLITSLKAVPVTFVKDLGPQSLLMPIMVPLMEPASESAKDSSSCSDASEEMSHHTTPTTPPPPVSQGLPLLSCDVNPSHITLLPPTPTPAGTLPSSAETCPKSSKATPLRSKQRRLRRRTLCANPNQTRVSIFTLQAYQLQLKQLQETVSDLTSSQADMEAQFPAKIEDAKVCIKNDLKGYFRTKFDSLSHAFDDAEKKIANLNETIEILSKENNTLKSQLGDIRAERKCRAQRPLSVDAGTQHQDQETVSNPPPTPPVIHLPLSQLPQCEEMNTGDVADQSDASVPGKGPPSIATVKTPVREDQPTEADQRQGSTQPQAPGSVHPPGQLTAEYAVPVSNKFAALSGSALLSDTSSDPPQVRPNLKSDSALSQSDRDVQKHSVSDLLDSQSVKEGSSALLIGDSVLSHLDPKRLALRSYRLQKVCVSGMTVGDVKRWLTRQPTNDSIRALVIHVGVNDCPAGPVTVDMWTDLIHLCHRVFPHADLGFSSVVPARGTQHINNAIFPTNRNLKKACVDCDITFIDNTHSFTALSGAPKQSMYRDVTHPSLKGTAQLASNIKSTFIDWIADRKPRQNNAQTERVSLDSRHNRYTRPQHWPRAPAPSRPLVQPHPTFFYPPQDRHVNEFPDRFSDMQSASRPPPHYYRNRSDASQAPRVDPTSAPYHQRQLDTSQVSGYAMPPTQSLHHFPVLTRQTYSQNPNSENAPPPPPAPPMADSFARTDRQVYDDHSNHRNQGTLPPPPLFTPEFSMNRTSWCDMNRYVHMLNMLTSQMLNSQGDRQ